MPLHIGLSNPLELEYMQEVYELEELAKMAYISSAERFGIEKGKLEVARNLLEEGVQVTLIKKWTGFSLAKLKKLQQEIKENAKSDH